LEIGPSSTGSRIFGAFSPQAKLPDSIADIKIGDCFVPMMFKEPGMNWPRAIILFPEIFDEDSLLPGYGKLTEGA
jgi:hypothetical protein